MREPDLLGALGEVIGSVHAVRNTRALMVLLGTFASAGLLVAGAEASLARGGAWAGPIEAGAALLVAFYGGNAAGILSMDDARGRRVRAIPDALRASLRCAHRLLLALAVVFAACSVAAALLYGLFWASREALTGRVVGPLLFGLAVPVGVLAVGLAGLALLAVVVPLAAPAVWSGAGVRQVVGSLAFVMRHRLPSALVLLAALGAITAGIGAVATGVVMLGGRVVSELGVAVVGVDVPARQLMAGLFGYGLRTLGAAGAPAGSSGHAAAALIGGGVVFAIALLLPTLVYLRGTCSVYLALADAPPARP